MGEVTDRGEEFINHGLTGRIDDKLAERGSSGWMRKLEGLSRRKTVAADLIYIVVFTGDPEDGDAGPAAFRLHPSRQGDSGEGLVENVEGTSEKSRLLAGDDAERVVPRETLQGGHRLRRLGQAPVLAGALEGGYKPLAVRRAVRGSFPAVLVREVSQRQLFADKGEPAFGIRGRQHRSVLGTVVPVERKTVDFHERAP